jgi:MAP/microtubule affinity-regulating kinase
MVKKLNNHRISYKIVIHNPYDGYAITEYIEGIDLINYINNPLSIKEKEDIIGIMIDILSHIHKKNILHGDIHIGQFRIDFNGNLKLLDFGLAKDINSKENNKTMGGIYEYLEPEFITPNPIHFFQPDNYSKTAEIYRLGITLYLILYNKYPFSGFTWKELYYNVMNSQPYYPHLTQNGEKIPDYIINIIQKCLHKNPFDRFKSADEIKK